MNADRYQELVGRVLDDEASPGELAELRHGLDGQPALLADFQVHLVIWELWSQQWQPERSADAFVAAWNTRLAAESQPDAFVERTVESLKRKRLTRLRPLDGLLGLLLLARARIRLAWCVAGAAAALVIGLCIWCFGPVVGDPVLVEVHGAGLNLEREGTPMPALAGTRLEPGDVLRTPGTATAAISFAPEKTRLTVEPAAELKLVSLSRGKQFDLRIGGLEASAARQRPFRPMLVTTPQAEARVVGTKFSLSVTTNATRLEVTEGNVRFTRLADKAVVDVHAGSYAVAATGYELLEQPLTGSLLREYWTNMPGEHWLNILTSDPNYPDHPNGREYLNKFEAPSNWGKDYGARLCGYLHPPVTGDYTLWLSGSDGTGLWFSPDDDPGHAKQVATAQNAQPLAWTEESFQQSPAIPLVAGRKYYIQALQKHGRGFDHLAVAWQGPALERQVIPGKFLSPLKPGPKEKKPWGPTANRH